MRYYSIVALLGLVALTGCGADTKSGEVKVQGTVSIDGQPVPTGSISFVAVDKSTPTGGGVIKEGNFTGYTMQGEKKVLIVGNKIVGQVKLYDTPDSGMRDKYESIVPPVYNAVQLTPLTVTIDGPRDDLSFELDSKAK
ncbi:hypothetical protein [Blastopirellula marina]|uniref:Carboxypeptidase regulatory-like domain-containing protein n=1 Tax=Blastopirellula marina DSM 3645 TaxID=314230 RepID=A3ZQS0_9BACT|nr:hypothetical protein [Blastopirellula marina]EAQ81010.1 hypothetical protein DSM3645_20602 [Blastopirellula marina DSM 3645]